MNLRLTTVIFSAVSLAGLASLTSCSPTPNTDVPGFDPEEGLPPKASWYLVKNATSTQIKNGERRQAKFLGHTVVSELTWRPFSKQEDGKIKTWYGDMGSPPPKLVADKLTITVDGVALSIPKSKYQYLATQWSREEVSEYLYFAYKKGYAVVVVSLGDGGESWAATYVIDMKTKKLLRHNVFDGPMVSEQLINL